jgi:hypothetical protein
MCNDRERLIGYVYDECDPTERQRIENHLAACADCRQEIAGLRAVRQDLLAWDVPSHASIWRPVTPVRTLSWRDVPAWAMAAAAGLVLMAGAVGGAAAQVLLSRPTGQVAQSEASAPMTRRPVVAETPTAADVGALERRLAVIRAELSAEMDERVRRVSAGQDRRAGAPELPQEYLQVMTSLYNQVVGVQHGLRGVENKVESVMAMTQPQTMPVSLQGQ